MRDAPTFHALCNHMTTWMKEIASFEDGLDAGNDAFPQSGACAAVHFFMRSCQIRMGVSK